MRLNAFNGSATIHEFKFCRKQLRPQITGELVEDVASGTSFHGAWKFTMHPLHQAFHSIDASIVPSIFHPPLLNAYWLFPDFPILFLPSIFSIQIKVSVPFLFIKFHQN
jgi:hypothetical protein